MEAKGPLRGMFFSAGELPALRARTDNPRYASLWAEISRTARRMGEARSLLLEGDSFTIWYYARNRLMDLALFTLLTGDPACAGALNQILCDLCARDVDFWQGPRYPNRPRAIRWRGEELPAGELETAQLAMGISIACDWAWDHLDGETRAAVTGALRDKAGPLLRNSVRFQSEQWVMNHLCVLSSGLALSALLLGEAGEDPAGDIELAARGLELWIEKVEEDGSYGEAYHYWAYPVNCLFFALYALRRLEGRELRGGGRLARCLHWALHNQVGKHRIEGFDGPLAVAVNAYDSPYVFGMEAPEALLFARHFGMPLGQWYIDRFLLERPEGPDCLHRWWHACPSILFALDDERAPAASPGELCTAPAAHFADTGFVYLRDGWDRCGEEGGDTVLALLSGGGGRSRSHEHYDKNSFSLFAGGEYLICDPGHSCYRGEGHRQYDTATRAHNTLTLGGADQTLAFVERGMLHDEAIAHPSYHNQAVIVGKNFQRELAYVASEARRCYTPHLNRFTRRILFLRPDCFLIWDTVDVGVAAAGGESRIGFNLNNRDGKTQLEVAQNRALVRRPRQNLLIDFLWPRAMRLERGEGRLHLAYHILPGQPVEGAPGSAIRLIPVPDRPDKTDYLYLLHPHRPDSRPLGAEITDEPVLRDGLLEEMEFAVTREGGLEYRFAIDGEALRCEGPDGESYRF